MKRGREALLCRREESSHSRRKAVLCRAQGSCRRPLCRLRGLVIPMETSLVDLATVMTRRPLETQSETKDLREHSCAIQSETTDDLRGKHA